MTISYVLGDVTDPRSLPHQGQDVIAHVCNDVGAFGAGVAAAIARRWPDVAQQFRAWASGRHPSGLRYGLGSVDWVRVSPTLTIANMVAQHGLPSHTNRHPIDYAALGICLQSLAERARESHSTIHMPRIGTGFAGGSWDHIEPLIQDACDGLHVVVYDLAGTS